MNDDNCYVKEEEENDKTRISNGLLDVKPLLPLYKRHPFTYSENGKYPYIWALKQRPRVFIENFIIFTWPKALIKKHIALWSLSLPLMKQIRSWDEFEILPTSIKWNNLDFCVILEFNCWSRKIRAMIVTHRDSRMRRLFITSIFYYYNYYHHKWRE